MAEFTLPSGFRFPTTSSERFNANLDAMKLVKTLDEEGRYASPEERLVLARYTGWGGSGFNVLFSGHAGSTAGMTSEEYEDARSLRQRIDELVEITTPEELDLIRRSRLNAFYTPEYIIESMWDGLKKMGVTASPQQKLRVLEPSAGIGRYLGLQPKDLAEHSERVAVEIDPFAAKMLKYTYPETEIYNTGFEEAPLANDSFDIAISNIPFDGAVSDAEFRRTARSKLTSPIHTYFFAKALDKVKPGGIVAFVAPTGTLDNSRLGDQRRYLAKNADLLGAIRLPAKAIETTDTLTDIIYLRKRKEGDPPGDDSWVNIEEISLPYYGYDRWRHGEKVRAPVNSYFAQNPEKIHGKQAAGGESMGRRNCRH